jgi:hypothetical protein
VARHRNKNPINGKSLDKLGLSSPSSSSSSSSSGKASYKHQPWTVTLEHYTGFQAPELYEAVLYLHRLVIKQHNLLKDSSKSAGSIAQKYSHRDLKRSSGIPPLEDAVLVTPIQQFLQQKRQELTQSPVASAPSSSSSSSSGNSPCPYTTELLSPTRLLSLRP